jgi:phasin
MAMQPTRFEIPEQMREVADKSVEQARQAIEQFLDAAQKAAASAEGSARTVRDGAADLSRQSLAFVEENIAASFDLAQRLVHARTVEEMTALQQEFFSRQMAAAAEQGKQIGGMVSRATSEAMQKASKKAGK